MLIFNIFILKIKFTGPGVEVGFFHLLKNQMDTYFKRQRISNLTRIDTKNKTISFSNPLKENEKEAIIRIIQNSSLVQNGKVKAKVA